MSDVVVEVLDIGIRVTQPGATYSVNYVRNESSRMLEAHELLAMPDIDGHEASFLAADWRAAYAKAKELGWI